VRKVNATVSSVVSASLHAKLLHHSARHLHRTVCTNVGIEVFAGAMKHIVKTATDQCKKAGVTPSASPTISPRLPEATSRSNPAQRAGMTPDFR